MLKQNTCEYNVGITKTEGTRMFNKPPLAVRQFVLNVLKIEFLTI